MFSTCSNQSTDCVLGGIGMLSGFLQSITETANETQNLQLVESVRSSVRSVGGAKFSFEEFRADVEKLWPSGQPSDEPEDRINRRLRYRSVLQEVIFTPNADLRLFKSLALSILGNFYPCTFVHICRGDKDREAAPMPIQAYIDAVIKLVPLPTVRNLFVLTDSTEALEELREKANLLDFTVYSLPFVKYLFPQVDSVKSMHCGLHKWH